MDLSDSKYQMAEYRLPIYGRDGGEWGRLAEWVGENGLIDRNVRWVIQVSSLLLVVLDLVEVGEIIGFEKMVVQRMNEIMI